jgi:lysophospholipase L1-like esterase
VNPLLMPVVAMQAMRLRPAIDMLAPAAGPTRGTVGGGDGEPMRLGVVGESTAAGYGVDTHDDGFAGCMARELAARSGRPVSWEVVGQHGATARRIRHRLLPRLEGDLDLAAVLAGVSDVFARRTPQEWGEDLAAIVDELCDRAERVVVTGTPPFDAFPAVPPTLGRYLTESAAAIDSVSRQVCAERPRATWVSALEIAPPDYFARDRFHPSAAGYRRWARTVADHLAR